MIKETGSTKEHPVKSDVRFYAHRFSYSIMQFRVRAGSLTDRSLEDLPCDPDEQAGTDDGDHDAPDQARGTDADQTAQESAERAANQTQDDVDDHGVRSPHDLAGKPARKTADDKSYDE